MNPFSVLNGIPFNQLFEALKNPNFQDYLEKYREKSGFAQGAGKLNLESILNPHPQSFQGEPTMTPETSAPSLMDMGGGWEPGQEMAGADEVKYKAQELTSAMQDSAGDTARGIGQIPRVVSQGVLQGGLGAIKTVANLADKINPAEQVRKTMVESMDIPDKYKVTPMDYVPGSAPTTTAYLNARNAAVTKNELMKGPGDIISEAIDPLIAASQDVIEEADMPSLGKKYFKGAGELLPTVAQLGFFTKALGPVAGMAMHGSLEGISRGDLKDALIGAATGAGMGKFSELAAPIRNSFLRGLANAGGFAGIENISQGLSTGKLPGINQDTISSALLGFALGMDGGEKVKVPRELTEPGGIANIKKAISAYILTPGELAVVKGGAKDVPLADTPLAVGAMGVEKRVDLVPDVRVVTPGETPGVPIRTPSEIQKDMVKLQENDLAPGEAPTPAETKGFATAGALTQMSPFKEANWWARMWLGSGRTVKRLVPWLKENGIDVADVNNPTFLQSATRGWLKSGERIQEAGPYVFDEAGNVQHIAPGLTSPMEVFKKKFNLNYKQSMSLFDDYFFMMRVKEDLSKRDIYKSTDGINAAGEKIQVTPLDIERARKIEERLTRDHPEKLNDLEAVTREKNKFQHGLLDMMVYSGRMSEADAAAIKADNQYHVPFDRIVPVEEGTPDKSGVFRTAAKKFTEKFSKSGQGTGTGGPGGQFKEFKGANAETYNAVDSMFKRTYQIAKIFSDNMLRRSIAKIGDVAPDVIWKEKRAVFPITIDAKEIARQLRKENPNVSPKMLDQMVAEATESMTTFRPDKIRLKDDQMLVWEEGKPQVYHVPESIARLFKHEDVKLGKNALDMVVAVLKPFKDVASWGISHSARFMGFNAAKDFHTRFIQNPADVQSLTVDPIKAIFDMANKSDMYDRFMAAGGGMGEGGFSLANYKYVERRSKDIFGDHNLAKNIFHGISGFASALEMWNKMANFETRKRQGASDIAAMSGARGSTTDWSEIGEHVSQLPGKVLPFFSASIAGTVRSAEQLFSRETWKPTVIKSVASVMLPSVMLYLYNNRDEQAKEEYKGLKRWEKDWFWNMKVGGIWWKFPKPPFYGQIFGSLPERALEYLHGEDSQAFDGFRSQMVGAITPVQGDSPAEVLPSIFKLFYELSSNESAFTGKPIYPTYKEDLLPESRYSDYTTGISKSIGGAVGVSPAAIDYSVRSLTGTVGADVYKLADWIVNPNKPRKPSNPPIAGAPFVGSFVSRDPSSSPQTLDDFYKFYDKMQEANNSWKQARDMYKKTGDTQYKADADDIMQEYPWASSLAENSKFNTLKRYAKIFSDVNKTITAIVGNPSLSDEEKRKRVEEQDKYKARRALEIYKMIFSR